MIITDDDILNLIRKNYKGFEDYTFKAQDISNEDRFIVVRDIHQINEDDLELSKDIFVRGLQISRQTNSINIVNICDSVNAESTGLDEKIYTALEKYNKSYTKAFLRNGSRWVDLGAFNLCAEKAREILGNPNPRTMFNISKYTYLLNNNLLNTANIRLSLVNIRSCLELMHLEIRKMNYDMVMRPVNTQSTNNGHETIIKTKYINNFTLHKDLRFDHEFLVLGSLAGLVARKNNGVFGEIVPYYYQFDLISVLQRDYSYLNLKVDVRPGIDKPVYVNNKRIAHKVVLLKKMVTCNFSPFSNLTAKLLANYRFSEKSDYYDNENPVEPSFYQDYELDKLLSTGEAIVVYKIDETLFDSYSIYDTINPQSGIVVEKGEIFNAPFSLFGIKYVSKTTLKNLWGFWEQILLFSKTNKSDQLQRIKLFDSLMMQQKNTIARAEQAEGLVIDLQKSNERINELNATLTEKVKERTLQLEQLNEQQRMNFINLVHETKTPLTLINNYLQEYIETHGTAEDLEIVKTAVNKLTKDMLNLFDIERFKKGLGVYKHTTICDFSQILKEGINLFKHHCKKLKLDFESDIQEGVFIKADPYAINRIVNNLIDNAVKFSEPGGKISVELKSLSGNILFKVSDSGRGIPLSFQKKIFEAYFQINKETSSQQGLGLGLPIVKKVIDSLDGTITIESEPPIKKGTTIVVVLKSYSLDKNDIVENPSPNSLSNFSTEIWESPELEYLSGRSSILLVEDNKTMLRYLSKKLQADYNLSYALNGTEALKIIQENKIKPDIIISDIMMDKMNGFSMAQILSEHKLYNHIPIIFLTALNTQQDKIKGLRAGAVDWIQKPFSFQELLLKIDSLLNRMEYQQKSFINQTVSNLKTGWGNDNQQVEELPILVNSCKRYRLTEREVEIVISINEGLSNKLLANKLSISLRTVSTHIQNIYQKLSVSSKTELLKKLRTNPEY